MAKLITLTDEQLLTIKQMAFNGATITEISNVLNLNRNKIKRTIQKHNFVHNRKTHVGAKVAWTDDMIAKLKVMYASDKIKIEDMVKSFNLSESVIVKKAKELNLIKNRVIPITHLSSEEQSYIRNNIEILSLSEIANNLKRKRDTIQRFVITEGLIYKTNKYPMPTSEEFANDIGNPMYSNAALGRIYGYTDLVIKKWREELFGDFQTMIDTYRCMTVPEIDFRDILEELDLSYLYEYKIDKWKVDFYLGCKLIVEIQGDYWHSLDKVKEKDNRKESSLKAMGYKILYINEKDITNTEEIKKLIIEEYKKAVIQWMLPS